MEANKTKVQITEDNIKDLHIKPGSIIIDKKGTYWKITRDDDFMASMVICDKNGNELRGENLKISGHSVVGGGIVSLLTDEGEYFIETESPEVNVKHDEGKKYNFFVKSTAEFDAFADFEPIINLTAKEAVSKFEELRNKGLNAGIGINIPNDIVFDDPEGNGITILVTDEKSLANFNIFGENFITDLNIKSEKDRSLLKNRIAAYEELYDELVEQSIPAIEPEFVYNKKFSMELSNIENEPVSEQSINSNVSIEINPVSLEEILDVMEMRPEINSEGKIKVYDIQRQEYIDNRSDFPPFDEDNWTFESAAEIFERLDTYINDYYIHDMQEQLESVGIEITGNETLSDLCNLYQSELSKGNKELSSGELNLAMGIVHPDTVIMPEKNIEQEQQVQEKSENNSIKTNYVLEKLSKAGIEVITDKEKFDTILENEKVLQKMTEDLSEFEELTEKLSEEKVKSEEIESQKQVLEEKKEEIKKENFTDFVNFVKSTQKFLPTYNVFKHKYVDRVEGKVPLLQDSYKNTWYVAFSIDDKGNTQPKIIYDHAGITQIQLDDYNEINRHSHLLNFEDNSLLNTYKENLKKYLEQRIVLEQQKQNRLTNEIAGIKTELVKTSIDGETLSADFASLDKSLRFNSNFEIESTKLGEEVSVFPGSTGKNGLGIRHIIEERYKKDNLSQDEITALSGLILDTVRSGKITRDSENRCEFSKNGIIAIVRKDFDNRKENWILTGFHYNGENEQKNREATEAIKTVIANYSNSNGYSYFRSQVGAVIASLDSNITQTPNMSSTQSIQNVQNDKQEILPQTEEKSSNSLDDGSMFVTQMKTEEVKAKIFVRTPNDIVPHLKNFAESEVENFGVVMLDASHRVREIRSLSVGTVNRSIVHAREVFKEAVRNSAAAVLIFHNHPSGNLEPSVDDINTTNKLLEASDIIGIPVLDHLIVSEEGYFSFVEHDMLNTITQHFVQGSTTYGFTHNGKIYLNPDVMNSEAAVHEYTHLWDNYTQRTNPELWEKGLNLFKNTSLWNDVLNDENYADIKDNEDLVLSECHARICGKIADAVLQKVLEKDGDLKQAEMIDWDKETWDYIASEIGFQEFDKVDPALKLRNDDLKEFLSMPMKDLFVNERKLEINQEEEIRPEFTIFDADDESISELKEHLSNNGYDVKWQDKDENNSLARFTCDIEEKAYIQTILEDRGIDYEYTLGLLSYGFDAAWLNADEQFDAKILSKEDFKRINKLKEKEFKDLKLPYITIDYTESSGSKNKLARMEAGTVLGLREGEELLKKLNNHFNTFLKCDITVYFPDANDNEPDSYSLRYDFTDNVRHLDNGKEVAYEREGLSEYIRMTCSYPEVLEKYEQQWQKVNAPDITDEQKKIVADIITPERESLSESYKKHCETLKEILEISKKNNAGLIINKAFADASIETEKDAVAVTFERYAGRCINSIADYLDENKDLSFKNEFINYAEHQISNMLQDVKYGESRNAKYGEHGYNFDFSLWRNSLEKVMDASEYNSFFTERLLAEEKSYTEIRNPANDMGTSKEETYSLSDEEWRACDELAEKAKMDWWFEEYGSDGNIHKNVSKQDLDDLSTGFDGYLTIDEKYRQPIKELFKRANIEFNDITLLTSQEISSRAENLYGFYFEYNDDEKCSDIYRSEDGDFVGSYSDGGFGYADGMGIDVPKIPDEVFQDVIALSRQFYIESDREIRSTLEEKNIEELKITQEEIHPDWKKLALYSVQNKETGEYEAVYDKEIEFINQNGRLTVFRKKAGLNEQGEQLYSVLEGSADFEKDNDKVVIIAENKLMDYLNNPQEFKNEMSVQKKIWMVLFIIPLLMNRKLIFLNLQRFLIRLSLLDYQKVSSSHIINTNFLSTKLKL